jgi:hypothetical protein
LVPENGSNWGLSRGVGRCPSDPWLDRGGWQANGAAVGDGRPETLGVLPVLSEHGGRRLASDASQIAGADYVEFGVISLTAAPH